MGLTIRWDPDGHVLRSTGDAPVGILVARHKVEGVRMAVSPDWQPPAKAPGERGEVVRASGITAEEVELEDIVEGLADQNAAEGFWSLMVSGLVRTTQDLLDAPNPLVLVLVEGWTGLVRESFDLLAKHDYIYGEEE